MPREGATTFSDLIGKLGSLRVVCNKCDRGGSYRLAYLFRFVAEMEKSSIGSPHSPPNAQERSLAT
jgi:hypothetical protein